jgi:hypothetical protein
METLEMCEEDGDIKHNTPGSLDSSMKSFSTFSLLITAEYRHDRSLNTIDFTLRCHASISYGRCL